MISIITLGAARSPITTKREAGESIVDAVERHMATLAAALPAGNKLMTTWQIAGGQEVVTTIRMAGESDESVLDRHLSAFPLP